MGLTEFQIKLFSEFSQNLQQLRQEKLLVQSGQEPVMENVFIRTRQLNAVSAPCTQIERILADACDNDVFESDYAFAGMSATNDRVNADFYLEDPTEGSFGTERLYVFYHSAGFENLSGNLIWQNVN